MKYVAVLMLGVILAGCKSTPGSSPSTLKDDKDKTSYALGVNLGKRLRADSIEINPEMFVRGVTDAADDSSKRLLTDAEVQSTLSKLDQSVAARRMAAAGAMGMKNKMEGEAFLEQNKKREGIVTLPSGLQYEVVKQGSGQVPKHGQTVETRYRGTLVNGTEFDNSEKHGGTVTFGIDQVIPAWTEALLKMNVGSRWKLFVPSQLAYGERGAGGMIGPNCTLIFDIELVAIK